MSSFFENLVTLDQWNNNLKPAIDNALSQMQALYDDLDPITEQATRDKLIEVADNIAAILNVNNNEPSINTLAAIDTQIAALAAIAADVTTNAENMPAIQAAFQNAQDAIAAATAAAESEEMSMKWATNPVDVPVETGPDRFSSLHHEVKTRQLYDLVAGLSNFAGKWSNFAPETALTEGHSVFHSGQLWFLLTDLADVTTSEPSSENDDWYHLTATILTQSLFAIADYYNQSDWTVGTGDTTIDIQFSGNIIVGLNGSWLFGGWTQDGDDLIIEEELQAGDTVAVLKMTDDVSLNQIVGLNVTDPQENDALIFEDGEFKNTPLLLEKLYIAQNPRLVVYDTFNRADGAIGNAITGQAWQFSANSYVVTNKSATISVTGSPNTGSDHPMRFCFIDSGHDETESVMKNAFSGGGYHSMLVSYIDSDNYLYVAFQSNGNIELNKVESGATRVILASESGTDFVNTSEAESRLYVRFVSSQIRVKAFWLGRLLEFQTNTTDGSTFEGGLSNVGFSVRRSTDHRVSQFEAYGFGV